MGMIYHAHNFGTDLCILVSAHPYLITYMVRSVMKHVSTVHGLYGYLLAPLQRNNRTITP